MQMTAETMFQDFPSKLRRFLKNLKAKAMSKSGMNASCWNPDARSQLARAVDAVEREGFLRIPELQKILPACGEYKGTVRLVHLLDDWEKDPGIPVDDPSQVAKEK